MKINVVKNGNEYGAFLGDFVGHGKTHKSALTQLRIAIQKAETQLKKQKVRLVECWHMVDWALSELENPTVVISAPRKKA